MVKNLLIVTSLIASCGNVIFIIVILKIVYSMVLIFHSQIFLVVHLLKVDLLNISLKVVLFMII